MVMISGLASPTNSPKMFPAAIYPKIYLRLKVDGRLRQAFAIGGYIQRYIGCTVVEEVVKPPVHLLTLVGKLATINYRRKCSAFI
jgi:hypothetical protein